MYIIIIGEIVCTCMYIYVDTYKYLFQRLGDPAQNFIRSLISEKVVSSAANFFPVGPKCEILNVLVELPKLGKSVTSGLWAILYNTYLYIIIMSFTSRPGGRFVLCMYVLYKYIIRTEMFPNRFGY